MNLKTNQIPLAYIHGTEASLLKNNDKLVGGDQIFLLLTEIRKKLLAGEISPLKVIDSFAEQFGVMEVDSELAKDVFKHCNYSNAPLKLVEARRARG